MYCIFRCLVGDDLSILLVDIEDDVLFFIDGFYYWGFWCVVIVVKNFCLFKEIFIIDVFFEFFDRNEVIVLVIDFVRVWFVCCVGDGEYYIWVLVE